MRFVGSGRVTVYTGSIGKKRSLVYYERRFSERRKIQILNQSPHNLKMNNITKDLISKAFYLGGLDFAVGFYFYSLNLISRTSFF